MRQYEAAILDAYSQGPLEFGQKPGLASQVSPSFIRKTGFLHGRTVSRDGGAADVCQYADRSRHHAQNKQRFVVSVVAYDSLPGHQRFHRTYPIYVRTGF